MQRKVALLMLILMIGLLVEIPAFAVIQDNSAMPILAKPEKPPKPPKGPKVSISVDIRNLGHGDVLDTLRQGATVDVIAKVTGTPNSVTYRVDGGTEVAMTQWDTSDRYYGSWTISQAVGSHSVTVTAYGGNPRKPKTYTDTATVEVVSGYNMVLHYEIDYMIGFKPSMAVLDTWVQYWDGRAIAVDYLLDDAVPHQYEISDPWAIEALYNDFSPDPNAPDWYNNPWKWMLWADYDVNHGVGGSTYVAIDSGDALGGNYITIYKGMIDDYYGPYGIAFGGEVVVTMHEAGHSIGVARLQCVGPYCYEVYDSDVYSIMSTMHLENAGFTNHWYYSWDYWDTRNDFY